MIELTFLKVLTLTKQVNQKNTMFLTVGICLHKGFKFQPDVYNGSHAVEKM